MAEKFRYIGVTDECVVCQRCGKVDLKSTVVLAVLDADGSEEDVTYYGSSCAGRALGIKASGAQIKKSAMWAMETTIRAAKDARGMLAYYGIPESGEVSSAVIRAAVVKFKLAHRSAGWFNEVTEAGWVDNVEDMIVRKRAAIRDAVLIGH